MPAIFDTSSSATRNTSASSLSWNHAIGNLGGAGLLIIGVSARTTVANYGNSVVASVTFNGVALTKVVEYGNNGGSQSMHASLWELHGASIPIAGTYAVVVTYTGTCDYESGGGMSFKNIQPKIAEESNGTSLNSNTSPSVSLTTLSPNALLVSIYGSQNDVTVTSNTGDTQGFHTGTNGATCAGFYRNIVIPALSTVALTVSNPEAEALVVAVFKTEQESALFFAQP